MWPERPRRKNPDVLNVRTLRVVPIGKDLSSPHKNMVPCFSRCPQGSVLLTLPIQGVERLGECFPEGRSPPPRRVVECSDQLFPASMLQGAVSVTRDVHPEASLERLVPLVEFLAEWEMLPNVSQWVLNTIENGSS